MINFFFIPNSRHNLKIDIDNINSLTAYIKCYVNATSKNNSPSCKNNFILATHHTSCLPTIRHTTSAFCRLTVVCVCVCINCRTLKFRVLAFYPPVSLLSLKCNHVQVFGNSSGMLVNFALHIFLRFD